jgi:hypothetical protein
MEASRKVEHSNQVSILFRRKPKVYSNKKEWGNSQTQGESKETVKRPTPGSRANET